MEEFERRGKRGAGGGGGVNRRSLGEVWGNINMPVFILVCV